MNHIWLNGRDGFTCSAFFELLVLPKLIRIAQLQVLPFPLFDGHLSDNLCILGCLQICMGFNNAIAAMCLHIKAIHGQQIQQSSSNERRLLCFSVEVQWWGGAPEVGWWLCHQDEIVIPGSKVCYQRSFKTSHYLH